MTSSPGSQAHVARSDRVALGPLRADLGREYARWVNDIEVKAGIFNQGIYTPADQVRFVEQMQADSSVRDPSSVHFTIYDIADDAPVGTLGLFDISWRHRRCELGIMIGERRGRGLGSAATLLGLDWAFNVMSLNNVVLHVLDYNGRAQRAYERAGFRLIGRRREAILAGGRLRDELIMDAIAADFGDSVVRSTELDTR